jgi:hypothetical protein
MSVDSTMLAWPSVPAARGLVHEALDDVGVGGQLGVQHLHGHPALDQRVLGEEHGPHAALSDALDDAVATVHDVAGLDRVVLLGWLHGDVMFDR